MSSSVSFLRQLSNGRDVCRSNSLRWGTSTTTTDDYHYYSGGGSQTEEELNNMYGGDHGNGGGMVVKKRVMVLVDQTSHSKHAMMWALTHVTNKGDLLTVLHVIPHNDNNSSSSSSSSSFLANNLGALCKACKPEVEVEALVIQGPKLATVISQVKKLEVSVLVLGQKKPSPFFSCLCGTRSTEEFVEQCIKNADCLTVGVRKQSEGMGGYIISTRWRKNFWLLA